MPHGLTRKWFGSAMVASTAMVVAVGLQTAVAPVAMGAADPSPPDGGRQSVAEIKQAYKDKAQAVKEKKDKAVTPADRQQATAVALQAGAVNPLMVEAVAAAATPLDEAGTPHYFSHPNYANSPLPEVSGGTAVAVGNELIERTYATDNASNVLVVLPQALPDGMVNAFQTLNQADQGSSSSPSAGAQFHAYVLRPTANGGEYTVVFDSGLLTVPALTTDGTSEVAEYPVANLAVQAGDRLAFYGRGVPFDRSPGDAVYYPSPTGPLQGSTITVGAGDFPTLAEDRTYSFAAQVVDMTNAGAIVDNTGMRKFVDELPQVGTDLPVAVPDTTTYEGSNYYEIALVEFEQQMHADLPPTKLRGYVQLATATVPAGPGSITVDGHQTVTAPTYMGPTITTDRDVPVRIKFYNLLPTGADGDLFLPVDSTVMGSGRTPTGNQGPDGQMVAEPDPQNPLCSGPDKSAAVATDECFSDNRSIVHLHGGITPWISDGTPHQWITPAGEDTQYPQGVSVQNVPDMDPASVDDTTDGAQTFYYTNAQSARLMFYHDHAWGITRLNVYAGMAAPYVISDDTEKALVSGQLIPDADATIPLVLQDKTFVPDQAQLDWQDELWDTARWGDKGDLWLPHVYSPAQNPGDASGVNAFGRWAYGPWFWPPTNSVENGPMDNAYYDPACDPDATWCEPPEMPGTPFNSMGMESFMDTPVINGKAYPTVELDPKAYRFRILNAANDRFFNLSLYRAVDANGDPCDASNTNPVAESTGVACTEVALNPDEVSAALTDPAGVFPTPVAGTEGPDWIAIANEGGFLPQPVSVPAHPITWVTDPTLFNAGNVDQHSLLVAPAERHDVVVDLSQYAGQTLIVYNDAPAAFPARDPRYDYYTGNADLRDSGGAPSTLPGYGPNTRTMMQIKVAPADPAPAFDLDALTGAFAHGVDANDQPMGVFETGQKPIVVGQSEYNSAYATSFTSGGSNNGTGQIYDTSLTFDTVGGENLTVPLGPKMIQDEQGEAFEPEYGRMSGFLGVETPNAQAGQQNMILNGFTRPPTEVLDGIEAADGLPPGFEADPIASADDGTQIWKFTHNGVDTHPIHFHLYDVQLVNRVGWDGIIRKPDATELGWKDTVRVSPLEDTIVALRPIIPPVPDEWGGLPNSIRLLDPSMPEGMYLDNTTAQEAAGLPIFAFNPDGEPIDVVNHKVNFGWEYVLHCHILSHEEMDMMHPQVVGIRPAAPSDVGAVRSGSGRNQQYEVTWTDNAKNETAYIVERRVEGSTDAWEVRTIIPTVTLDETPGTVSPDAADTGTRTWVDEIGNDRNLYEYQVHTQNTVGDVWDYSDPALNNLPPGGGFPTLTLDSRGNSVTTLAAPSDLTATATAKNKKTAVVSLSWTDNSEERGFLIQRADNASFTVGVDNLTVAANATTATQSVARGKTYYYRVLAFTDAHQSAWSNTASVTTP